MIAESQEIQNAELQYRLAAEEQLRDDPAPTHAELSAIGVTLIHEFAQAENDRRLTELRWLMDLRQYRGQYDPEVLAKLGPNRSRAFVRKTRVKVNTVDARVYDLLFPANSNRNWSCDSTPDPTLTPEQRQKIKQELSAILGRMPTREEAKKAGIEVAKRAAGAMSRTIDDQLIEAGYSDICKQVIHSGNLYGTGIIKAPLVEKKIRTRFVNENGKWVMKTEEYRVPFVDFVPLWRFYPDMTATTIDECRYAYERHLMNKAAMLKLATKKSFNGAKIREYVMSNPDGQVKLRYYDNELRIIGERQSTQIQKGGQYEVLERWGWLDAAQLMACGVNVPQNRIHETFFSNVWLLPNGEIIKAVLQPINGVTWPYHFYYFDKDETSIFAEGLAAIMRDDQTMINASARMVLDNAALTAGPQIEANMSLLSRGEKANEIAPFKIWPRSGIGEDARAPALRVIEIPSHVRELSEIMGLFENNADEVTAIPRYLYGENPSNGAAGTMGGLSMLMGSAAIVLKNMVSAFDVGITAKVITGIYRWNMQFNPDPDIKGDFDVKATGTSSIVAKEVRAQQLEQFAAQTANPMDAPFVKREKLLRQRADAHDLSDVVKTEDEVKAEQNSELMQAQQQLAQAQQQLMLKELEGKVGELMAKIGKLSAETDNIRAKTVQANVASAYSAMQAGGVAVTSSSIAPAADEILRSSGWQDATPDQSNAGAVNVAPQENANVPQGGPAAGMQQGMNAGVETPMLGDGGV